MAARELCIIGAGNGGSAIAGDMALAGHRCRLFEFPEYAENLRPIAEQGGIHVTGVASHAGSAPEDGASAIAIASLAIAQLHRDGWHGRIEKNGRCGTSNV